ncbi:polyprenol phosphomannose-dependent alpha 1,6 mannosyltransferase MptB [Streptomyces sp. TLI_171]|uniref:polyprenol phosphomannose-dependent alpha 1,6 mannosyltransferase MptB n=1 Tax=Streptomyces sp. TLI_171 TaxID=1938859 RepID=UPI000C1A3516|nr:polyprenol phosphomannose-dependent alpha 1,6 mannosyltransferase MptB [Streptomyces sp. TLI_171]RKE22911.1 alpha-1,6-mannosyltransferase/alpha-1,6-mannosyltransferase [Streptomyces sp. TLI_171]
MPNTGANAYPSRYRWLGLLGSLALAGGGLTSGALPAADTGPTLRASGGAGTVLVFAGLAVLTAAWLLLGRPADGQPPPRARWLAATLAWWAAPLLLLPPLFSRDVYSYLAQGALLESGFDVYTVGPAALGGAVAQQVPHVWQDTPAPYGPGFMLLARATAPLAEHPYAGTLLLRLTAVLAVAALAALLVALARAIGADPAAALRLGALNPLVLLHLIAGAHNDAPPLALMLGGLLAAARRRPLLAAALVTAAALVKAPALLALPAVWWLVAHDRAGPRRLRAAGQVLAAAAVTTAAVTAAAGTGYGWITALTTPATATSWSLTSSFGRTLADLTGAAPAATVTTVRLLGLALAAATILLLALRVGRAEHDPLAALALGFGALVALGPAFRPWYALWCLVPAALAARTPNARRLAELACLIMAFTVMPDGFGPDSAELVLTAGGLAIGAFTVLLAERQMAFQERQLAC